MDNVNWDPRLVEVEEEKKAALQETDQEYEALIDQNQDYYDGLIALEEVNRQAQEQAQQEKTDLEVELHQKQDDAAQELAQKQTDAYTDYQQQVNPYGVVAETVAQEGLSGSGYSESLKTRLLTDYENRMAAAQQGFAQAMQEYDNALQEAQRLNDAALAKIAYNALKRKSDLSLKAVTKYNQLWQKWQDQRVDLEEFYREWEEEVRKEIQLDPWPAAVEPPRLSGSPDADTKRWAI